MSSPAWVGVVPKFLRPTGTPALPGSGWTCRANRGILASMATMLEQIAEDARKILRDASLDPGGPPLLVAVSGGCDSVVLFHVLLELGYPLAVAHVDHGTRGEASRDDAAFTASLAAGFKVPCHVTRRAVPGEARAAGVSVEQQGRRARYAYFTALVREHGYAGIATGHHADDQAETLLLRILRGTGPEGLGGIAPVREIAGIPLVRPLLGCRREALMACAEAEGWGYREDASNADTRIPRNRVRHELAPLLRAGYNPAVAGALGRLAALNRVQEDFMAPRVAEAYAACVGPDGIARAAFAAFHAALRHRVIARYLQSQGVEHPCQRVIALAEFVANAPTGRYADAGGGLQLHAGRTHATLVAHTARNGAQTVALPTPGETAAHGYVFRCEMIAEVPRDPASCCGPDYQVFDAARLVGGLRARTRRAGDRFSPIGLNGTKKLKDYFIARGVPAPQRDAAPLVLDDAGIVWVVGHGPAARVCVDETTTRCMAVQATPLVSEANRAAR